MAITTTMYVGDLDPTYTTQLLEPDGVTPVNLAGLSGSNIVLKWQAYDLPNTTVTGSGTVTIVTASTGNISYAWATGDTSTAGTYHFWAVVTFVGSKPQHIDLGELQIKAAP